MNFSKFFIFSVCGLLGLTAFGNDTLVNVQKNLDGARVEIGAVILSLPENLRLVHGKSLESANEKIAIALQQLTNQNCGSLYYCVVDSVDGTFGGKATTELEATKLASDACRAKSRNEGRFCLFEKPRCQREKN